jgi:hypothetical protein
MNTVQTAYAMRIGAVLLMVLFIAWKFAQASRKARKMDRALEALGAGRSLSLGTCLSGLRELEPPTLVSCGATATEIIFLAENDCREIGRIPRGSILGVFGGEESDTHAHLAALDGLPSLILAQSENRRRERKEGTSYTVIDWSDGPSRRRQIVFKSRGKTAGRWCAVALDVMRGTRPLFPGLSERIEAAKIKREKDMRDMQS